MTHNSNSSSKILSFQQLQEKYQISEYGFLYNPCLTQLPEQFKDLQILKQHLPHTLSSKFGQIADSLVYSQEKHSFKNLNLTKRQQKFMYAFLTLCYSRYIWENGVNNPRKVVPQIIALPFIQICQIIRIRPSIAYASQITYNWGFKGQTKQMKLQNLYCPMTMSGTRAEQWFYLIMIGIQIVGAQCVQGIINSQYLSQQNLLQLLKNLKKALMKMKHIMKRMYEQNPLDIYNDKVRQYLMGAKNINKGLGVRVKDTEIMLSQTGGSAAQSPIIQAITIFLRIQLQEATKQFIERNKSYMPKTQRDYLSDLQMMPSIKQKIQKSGNLNLINAFDQCIEALHQFRCIHFGVVDHYVFKHLKNQNSLGTGSSNAKGFLSSMMKDTSFGKISQKQNKHDTVKQKKHKHQKHAVQKEDGNRGVYGVSIVSLTFLIIFGLAFFGIIYGNDILEQLYHSIPTDLRGNNQQKYVNQVIEQEN